MQIQILDSWLREHLKTKASATKIAEILSLKSASVERVEKVGNDFLYDIEVTTNRVDMMSVIGLAREAAVALNSEGIEAEFIEKNIPTHTISSKNFPVGIKNDPKLCNRICAAILEVKIEKSPQIIRDRLEASDVRSLNNVIDVTNYVMKEIGHPMHAFDADKVSDTFTIREGKQGEKITTLDKKEYVLTGGEIVAENKNGEIIDLLGIMGLSNSAITDSTSRVMLFIGNNNSKKIRDASMTLNIRTDAAVLNEKDVDPEFGLLALNRGIQLLQEIAQGKLVSHIFDEYPKKEKPKPVTIQLSKIQNVIGVDISKHESEQILKGLGFEVKTLKDEFTVTAPSYRAHEIEIPEDIIEEVARMYGYHKIPSILPIIQNTHYTSFSHNAFYLETRVKHALKYFGFTEVYTYSLVSEDMLEVAPQDAVELLNPLSSDMTHLRTTLIPSLLEALRENKQLPELKIFELSNVYHKRAQDLPIETKMLAGIIKHKKADFYTAKGVLEALFKDLGITNVTYKKRDDAEGAYISIGKKEIGEIEVLDSGVVDFELHYDELIKHVSLKKVYVPVPKFPEAVEDIRVIISPEIEYKMVADTIKSASTLVKNVELLDVYQDKKTFRITYQSREKSLTSGEITEIREKILEHLKKHLNAEAA